MSLLGDVRTSLENNPKLVVVGIDYRSVFGRFNTHVFRTAPEQRLNYNDMLELLYALQLWTSHQPHRVLNFFDQVSPYGEVIYKETIGKEKVLRTFTVDDASKHSGEEFTRGAQEPVENELVRDIKVVLYPTAKVARLHTHGLTIYEAPISVAA